MGIRGIAACLVVLFHVHPVLFLLLPATTGGFNELGSAMVLVDFFFMLSGFVIAHNYVVDLAHPTGARLRRYAVLRIARIWPLHAVMVIAFLAYGRLSTVVHGYGLEGDSSAANVAANLAMLHEFAPFSSINIPSWSMAPELGAYLAFPLLAPLLLVLSRHRAVALGLMLAWLFLGTCALWWLYRDLGIDDWSHVVAWLRVAVSFPVGCLLAVLWRQLPALARRHRGWDVTAAAAAAGAAVVAVGLNRGAEFREPVAAYPLLALLVIACAGACGPAERILSWGPVHWLGRMSYALYLTHFLVVVTFYAVLSRTGAVNASLPVRLLIVVALAALIVLAGVVAHHAVEEPARRWVRRLGLPRTRLREPARRSDRLSS